MKTHIKAAPSVADEPTQDHCSGVTSNPKTVWLIAGISAGDDQANAAPAAKAPAVAVNAEEMG